MDFFTKLAQEAQKMAARAEEIARDLDTQLNPLVEQVSSQVRDFAANAERTVQDLMQQFATANPQFDGMMDTLRQKYDETEAFVKQHIDQLNLAETLPLDEIGRKIASLGTPALAFVVAASIAGGMGLAGGAVVTTALAMLGGPVGMIGGLITLGVLGLIADAVAKYGVDEVLYATFNAKQEQGATRESMISEINGLPISMELKLKLQQRLGLL